MYFRELCRLSRFVTVFSIGTLLSVPAAFGETVCSRFTGLVLTVASTDDLVLSRGEGPFDIDANGTAESVHWPSTRKGNAVVLWMDNNNDDELTDGTELIGSVARLSNGRTGATSAEVLAELDSNEDGVIDSTDSGWRVLRFWRDTDGDAGTRRGELGNLDELGVRSISVRAVLAPRSSGEISVPILYFFDVRMRDVVAPGLRAAEFCFPCSAINRSKE